MVIAESEPINLNAYNSLDLLASAGYIEKGAVKRAREIGGLAANTGLTIGFELEVTGGSIVDLPNRLDPDAAKQLCKQFGFNHSYDEEYEVIMPPANHPYIAQLLLHGAIRNGLIPAETDGIVSSHINIGNIVTPTYQSETLFNLILITRAIEQIGGSSPERLLSPIGTHSKNPDSSPIHSWNCRSTGGID